MSEDSSEEPTISHEISMENADRIRRRKTMPDRLGITQEQFAQHHRIVYWEQGASAEEAAGQLGLTRRQYQEAATRWGETFRPSTTPDRFVSLTEEQKTAAIARRRETIAQRKQRKDLEVIETLPDTVRKVAKGLYNEGIPLKHIDRRTKFTPTTHRNPPRRK